MSRVRLSADGCLELRQCFAGSDALVPRVIKIGVSTTSAVSEPRTTATATTAFTRFRDGAASGAYGNGDRRRRVCRCFHVLWSRRKKKNSKQSLFSLNDNVWITCR